MRKLIADLVKSYRSIKATFAADALAQRNHERERRLDRVNREHVEHWFSML